MKRVIAIICLALVTVAHANAFVDGFKTKDVSKYLKNAASMDQDAVVVDIDGTLALQLRFDNELFAEFHAMPVKAGQAYTFGFRGKWANKETLESNPTFETAVRETWETGLESLPTLALEFLDSGRKPLKFRSIAVLPYGQWKDYRYAFLSPPGAAFVVLKVKSGRNDGSFFIANPTFAAQDASTDAIVMDFSKFTAEQGGKAFGLLVDGQVRGGLAVGVGGRSDMIAAREGAHRLTVKGQSLGKSSTITMAFFDTEGKRLSEVTAPNPADKPLEFTAPPKTVAVQLVVNSLVLDEIRIEPVR